MTDKLELTNDDASTNNRIRYEASVDLDKSGVKNNVVTAICIHRKNRSQVIIDCLVIGLRYWDPESVFDYTPQEGAPIDDFNPSVPQGNVAVVCLPKAIWSELNNVAATYDFNRSTMARESVRIGMPIYLAQGCNDIDAENRAKVWAKAEVDAVIEKMTEPEPEDDNPTEPEDDNSVLQAGDMKVELTSDGNIHITSLTSINIEIISSSEIKVR